MTAYLDPQFDQMLKHLQRGGSFGYWWESTGKHSSWWPSNNIGKFPPTWEDRRDVYFGVYPSSVKGKRGTIATTAALNCVFAEFDAKDFVQPDEYAHHLPSDFHQLDAKNQTAAIAEAQRTEAARIAIYKDRALAHVLALSVQPSIIVDSGGGWHCYWLLRDTFTIENSEDRSLAQSVLYAWIDTVGGDGGAKDLARVLRVPGTLNHKYTPPRPVSFYHFDMGLLYDWSTILELTADKRVAARVSSPTAPNEVTEEYVRKAFDDEIAKLAATSTNRNKQLFVTTANLAELIADGLLSESEVIAALESTARAIGLEDREIGATIASGLKTGKANPRGLRLKQKRATSDNGGDPGTEWGAAGGNGDELGAGFDLLHYSPEEGSVLDIWLAEHKQQYLYAADWNKWHEWTGTHWEALRGAAVERQVQHLLASLHRIAQALVKEAKADDDKATMSLAGQWCGVTKRTDHRVRSITSMAARWLAVGVEDLDAGDALNLANGVLDLRTLSLIPHDRTQRYTYSLPYAYDETATAPRWLRYLTEAIVREDGTPDSETVQFLQQAVGYSLTGDTHLETMFWLSGEGSNGKTVFLTILRELLGPMAISIDFQSIGQPGNYDLASLPNKRVVLSTEAKKGGVLATEDIIKRLVSGETINARAIRGEPFEFRARAKLWWAMNDKPLIKDTSNAIWRRLKLVEFRREFTETEKDPFLVNKLRVELPGILNWALAGLRELRAAGRFIEPASMRAARDEYKRESNPVLQWLEERTKPVESDDFNEWTTATELFSDYRQWGEDNGRRSFNLTQWGREVVRLKVRKEKPTGGRHRNCMVYARQLLPPTGALAKAKAAAEDFLNEAGL